MTLPSLGGVGTQIQSEIVGCPLWYYHIPLDKVHFDIGRYTLVLKGTCKYYQVVRYLLVYRQKLYHDSGSE